MIITNDELGFECKRCGEEEQKESAMDSEYGYISVVDRSWVGPLCFKCVDELRKNKQSLVEKKVPETIFAIIVYPDGAGAVFTDFEVAKEVISAYRRAPKPYDIISACNYVVEDLKNSKIFSQLSTINRKA